MRRRRSPSKKQLLKRSIFVNERIQAGTLRVLSDEGEFLGIMSRNDALSRARTEGLDLVEVAPKAQPPVAKIIDFNKYLYQLAKKTKNEKKGKTETKELKIGLFMADHDVARLIRRAGEFLKDGHQVRISLWLKGRELGKKEDAKAFLISFISKIEDAKAVSEPAFHGRVLRVVISYEKKKNE